MGCDLAQGFVLSEPVPFAQLGSRMDELEAAFV